MARLPGGDAIVPEYRRNIPQDSPRTYHFAFAAGGANNAGRSDIRVFLRGASIDDGQYRVTLNPGGRGGSVEFLTTGDGISNPVVLNPGDELVIRRDTTVERSTSFGAKGYAASAAVESFAAKTTRVIEEIVEDASQTRAAANVRITDVKQFARESRRAGGRAINPTDLSPDPTEAGSGAIRDFARYDREGGAAKIQTGDLGFTLGPHTTRDLQAADINPFVKDFAREPDPMANPPVPDEKIESGDLENTIRQRIFDPASTSFDDATGVLSSTDLNTDPVRIQLRTGQQVDDRADNRIDAARGKVDGWIGENPNVQAGVQAADALEHDDNTLVTTRTITLSAANTYVRLGTAALPGAETGRELVFHGTPTGESGVEVTIPLHTLRAKPFSTVGGSPAGGMNGVRFGTPDGYTGYIGRLSGNTGFLFASDRTGPWSVQLIDKQHSVLGALPIDDAELQKTGTPQELGIKEVAASKVMVNTSGFAAGPGPLLAADDTVQKALSRLDAQAAVAGSGRGSRVLPRTILPSWTTAANGWWGITREQFEANRTLRLRGPVSAPAGYTHTVIALPQAGAGDYAGEVRGELMIVVNESVTPIWVTTAAVSPNQQTLPSMAGDDIVVVAPEETRLVLVVGNTRVEHVLLEPDIDPSELYAVADPPTDTSDGKIGDIANVEGNLYELIGGGTDRHVYHSTVETTGLGTDFIGDATFKWKEGPPSEIEFLPLQSQIGASPPSQIWMEVIIPGHDGIYSEISVSRQGSAATGTPPRWRYTKTPGEPGLDSDPTDVYANRPFSISAYSDEDKQTELNIVASTNRWVPKATHDAQGGFPAGGTQGQVVTRDSQGGLVWTSSPIPTGNTLPRRPHIDDRFRLLEDDIVPHDFSVQDTDASADAAQFIFPETSTLTGVYAIVSFSDEYGTTALQMARRGKTFLQVQGAFVPDNDAEVVLYRTGTFDRATHTYDVSDMPQSAQDTHLYEVTDLNWDAKFNSGFWSINFLSATQGNKGRDVSVEAGDLSYAGGNEGQAGWVKTPGLAAPWATQGQPNPRTLLAANRLIDGPGIGLTYSGGNSPFYAPSPGLQLFRPKGPTSTFDLDSDNNQVGVIEIEATLALSGQSHTTITWGNGRTVQRMEGLIFPSDLRDSTVFAQGSATVGVEIATWTVERAGTEIGTVELRLARDGNNNLGYFFVGTTTTTANRWSFGATMRAVFLHNDGAGGTGTVDVEAPSTLLTDDRTTNTRIDTAAYETTETFSTALPSDGSKDDYLLAFAFAVGTSTGDSETDNHPQTTEVMVRAGDWRTRANAASATVAINTYGWSTLLAGSTGHDDARRNLFFTKGPNGRVMVRVQSGETGLLHWMRVRLIPGGGVKGDKGDKGDPGEGTSIPRYATLAALPAPASLDAGARAEVIEETAPYAVMDFSVTGHASGSRQWKCIGGSSRDLVGTSGIRIPASQSGALVADRWYQIQTGTSPATYAEWDFRFPFFQIAFGGAGGPVNGPYWYAAQWFTFDAEAINALSAGVAGQDSTSSGAFLEVSLWQENIGSGVGSLKIGDPRFRVIRLGRTSANRILVASRQAIGTTSPNPPHIVPFRVRGHA